MALCDASEGNTWASAEVGSSPTAVGSIHWIFGLLGAQWAGLLATRFLRNAAFNVQRHL